MRMWLPPGDLSPNPSVSEDAMTLESIMPQHHPIKITSKNFQSEIIDSKEPVVVDFWAPWCGPCRAIGPVLEELVQKHSGKVKVAKINVDEEGALAGKFNIRGIPTLIVYHQGKEVGKVVGFHGKPAMEQLFTDLSALSASAPVSFSADRG